MRSLEEINRDLILLQQDEDRSKRLDTMIDDLNSQRIQRRQAVQQAQAILDKEEGDVEELERLSFSSFVARIRGELEERTDRERREAVAAKARYAAAVRDQNDLELRLQALQQELSGLGNLEQRRHALLQEKEAAFHTLGVGPFSQLEELAQSITRLECQLREVSQALCAGQNADHALEQMEQELSSASGWGTVDIFGGGLLSNLAKHDHIDRARSCSDQARAALSRFRTELADVSVGHVPDVEIGSFAVFADYFFDGIFADLFVQDKIRQAQSSVAAARRNTAELVCKLKLERTRLTQQKAALALEREQLLLKG